MAFFQEIKSEHIRQTIDTEQVFSEWHAASTELDHRFRGSLSWKTVSERQYLYRKTDKTWKSLGARSVETEKLHDQFHADRDVLKGRVASLAGRLDEMASINRAMQVGRIPVLTARLLRALSRSGLIGSAIDVVGTNALYVYERLCGVRIESGLLATGDIDLLLDSRANVNLILSRGRPSGLMKILQSVDRSFQPTSRSSFRAANKDGFLVDLITPQAGAPMTSGNNKPIGDHDDELVAVEIEGLEWLVNSPKIDTVILDERGYPLRCTSPDPRSFALHKLWLSQRDDRDPLKRIRDRQQALLLADMLGKRMPHLKFDDPKLGAVPKALRQLAEQLQDISTAPTTEPGW